MAIEDGPQEVSMYRQVDWRRYATARLSTEYDSEGSVFVNKFSSRQRKLQDHSKERHLETYATLRWVWSQSIYL